MKPEKFDGRSSFETFMCMFENCARYNQWNRRDKAAHLRWSLTGTAAQLLWNTESLSYEDLVEKNYEIVSAEKGWRNVFKRNFVVVDESKENR